MSIVRLLPGPHISEEAPSSSGRKSADKCTQASMAMGLAAVKQPNMSQQACIDLMYDMADHMQTVGDFKPGSGSKFEGAKKELEYRGLTIKEYHPFAGGPLDLNTVHDVFRQYAGAYPLIVQFLQAHMLIDTAAVHRDPNVQCHAIYFPAKATEGYPTADPNNPTVMQTLDTYPWDYVGADGNHYGISQAQPCAIIVLDMPAKVTPGLPSGWQDDGATLTAPNGITINGALRDYVLAYPGGWPAWNQPAAPMRQSGEEWILTFVDGPELGWTQAGGVVWGGIGQEVLDLRKRVFDLEQELTQGNNDKTTIQGVLADLANLSNTLAPLAK